MRKPVIYKCGLWYIVADFWFVIIYIYTHRKSKKYIFLKLEVASPSAWAMALGEEGFSKQQLTSFPECLRLALGEEGFKKKQISSPSVALGEEFFQKKKHRTAPTVSNLPRVLRRHSGRLPRVHDFWHSGKTYFPWEASPEALPRVLHSGKASPSVVAPSPSAFGTRGSKRLL
jgi:hypothetical protein